MRSSTRRDHPRGRATIMCALTGVRAVGQRRPKCVTQRPAGMGTTRSIDICSSIRSRSTFSGSCRIAGCPPSRRDADSARSG